MSLPERTEYLVVGAGPTGLTCALALSKHGCKDITIVDAVEHGEDSSRAVVLHSATVEALDTVASIQPFIDEGNKETIFKIWDGVQFHVVADFDTLIPYTKYPFILVIPQYVTERILGEQVQQQGIRVCRPHRVVGLKINEKDTNMTDVLFEDGRSIQARYVIGADGARSAVRQATGIRFEDPYPVAHPADEPPPTISMVLADVTFTNPPPQEFEQMAFMFSPLSAYLHIPLPNSAYGVKDKVYRIGSGIPVSMGTPPSSPSISYLQDLITQFGPGQMKVPSEDPPDMKIDKVLWTTRFRTHSAIADNFFTRLGWNSGNHCSGGVIVLLGDAAHIHPPAGGQGMNLGIRDAVTLGSALAAHASNTEPAISPSEYRKLDTPLRDWALERRDKGLTVIRLTKRLLTVARATVDPTWHLWIIPINWMKIRNFMLGVVSRFRVTQRAAAWQLSGLGNR